MSSKYTVQMEDNSLGETESDFGDEPLSPIDYAPSIGGPSLPAPLSPQSVEVLHNSQLIQPKDIYHQFAKDANEAHIFNSYDEKDIQIAGIRCLFSKAKQYLSPGPAFRAVIRLYAERKLLVFFMMHFMATIIIWFHFFIIKFEQQKMAVPEEAPSYWWKRLVPPLEFGSMHAILFQMALIPLTMCRFSLATLSDSLVDRFVPLNRMLRIHIHLGYTMVIIVFLATLFFFTFFGLLCSRGEEQFCAKFRSEIMATGYAILGFLLIIAGTSHFRNKIPYEVFYAIHHLVFIMYAVTIAHTFDVQQRNNTKERSQTFKWFSATLLFYFCDRAAMHLNHKYRARLVSSSTVVGSDGSRMLVLKLQRPALFRFRPGQYAYLKFGKIDAHWHPFSIASGPDSAELEFYVEVFDDNSWTGQLWSLMEDNVEVDGSCSLREIFIEVMGPFGTSLAKTDNFSHGLALGTGTGIVPVLSLFKEHVRQLLRLDPENYCKELEDCQERAGRIQVAEEMQKGSFAQIICSGIKKQPYERLREQTKSDSLREAIKSTISKRQDLSPGAKSKHSRGNMRKMKQAAFWATRSIYGVAFLTLLPVFGISLIALTISWNTVNAELFSGMVEFLQIATVLFHICYASVSIFIWDANQFCAYTDLVFCLLAPFVDWYWYGVYRDRGLLSPGDITNYCLFSGYMALRAWNMTVRPRHQARHSGDCRGVRTLERLEVVWVARSSSMVARIIPDINKIWKGLVDIWGEEKALSVCRLSVYVTDKDAKARQLLKRELRGSPLYESGAIHFGRPDFGRLIEDHTIDMISSRRTSNSLLAYVGSPELAREIHRLKISNDMTTAITGNKRHQMEFVAENYGNAKPKTRFELHDEDRYTVRHDISYDNGPSRFQTAIEPKLPH